MKTIKIEKNNELFAHSSAPWQQVILEGYLKKINTTKEWKCLDLGCGIGNNLETISKFTKDIIALDRSERALDFCKNRYKNLKIQYILGDIHKLPFEERTFGLVICTEVIEHSRLPQKVIEESKRILKPNGYLVLSSQNYFNLSGLIKIFIDYANKRQTWDVWGTHKKDFENFITSLWIKSTAKRMGFKILDERGADYLNAWLIWVPFVYQNYKLLNRFPFFILGRLPFIKKIGMDYFLLLQKI